MPLTTLTKRRYLLAIQREAVIVVEVTVAKDETDGAVAGRAQINTEPVISPIDGLLFVSRIQSWVVAEHQYRTRFDRISRIVRSALDFTRLYQEASWRRGGFTHFPLRWSIGVTFIMHLPTSQFAGRTLRRLLRRSCENLLAVAAESSALHTPYPVRARARLWPK